jgi:hypothetical protein
MTWSTNMADEKCVKNFKYFMTMQWSFSVSVTDMWIHYIRRKLPTRFGQLLWSSSRRCRTKNVLHRTRNQWIHIKYQVVNVNLQNADKIIRGKFTSSCVVCDVAPSGQLIDDTLSAGRTARPLTTRANLAQIIICVLYILTYFKPYI